MPPHFCRVLFLYRRPSPCPFFFFNDTATTEIYTLSLHDALPICTVGATGRCPGRCVDPPHRSAASRDRKSTRLNSSHSQISYAVFCLKKKKRNSWASARAAKDPHSCQWHHLYQRQSPARAPA